MAASVEQLFYAAREYPAGDARANFLDSACGQDGALRELVELLLTAEADAGAFLTGESPRQFEDGRPGEAPSPRAHQIGEMVGRYKLLHLIGEGGFGSVYLAEQQEPVRRRVALKAIKLGMDTREVIARFEAERQALALMDHPGIARVLDAGSTIAGRPYFVMEYIEGVPILEYCDSEKLDTRRRLELFTKVCHAIQHAHQKGIIHRDIKPSNVLVVMQDNVPVPKVIDFGIAKATRAELTARTLFTQHDQLIGTPVYMSPEQAEMTGTDIDTRSDIYSLGVLLYELLTGTTPFDKTELKSRGFAEMMRIIREVEPHRPSTRLSSLSRLAPRDAQQPRALDSRKLIHTLRGDLDWIVMRCLEKDRARRYETANGLAMDVDRYLSGEPVFAAPPSVPYRFRKFVRRHRGIVSAASAVGTSLLIGAIAFAYQANIAVSQRDRAEQQLARAERLVYSGKLLQAQTNFEVGNGELALHYLRECDPDLRGWEWRYLWTRVNAQVSLVGHGEAVTSAAFSPDGRRVATGSQDGTAKVWDAATGQELFTLKLDTGFVLCVAFSHDGRSILTAGGSWGVGEDPGEVKVWNAADGRLVRDLKGHRYCSWSAAFSPDDRLIVSSAGDWAHGPPEVKLWDATSGKELRSFEGISATVRCVAFAPDGQHILAGSQDCSARVLDIATGEAVFLLKDCASGIRSAAFSPDGRRIVTADGNFHFSAKVWDTATGKELFALKGHAERVDSVAYSPDGGRIITGSVDRTINVWDAATGRVLLTLKGHAGPVRSVSFSPDGLRIISAGNDGMAKIWDAQQGQRVPVLSGHKDFISGITFSPDSARIVTGSGDGTAKIWDSATGAELATLGSPGPYSIAGVWGVALSPDGRRVATASQDRTAKVWDLSTGAVLVVLEHSDIVSSVAFSPDGERVVTGVGTWMRPGEERPGEAKVWDVASGRELLILKGHAGAVCGVAFHPDGKRIVTGSQDGTAKVWDAATGRELFVLRGHASGVYCVAFSPDGGRISTGSRDTTAKVWENASGQELFTLEGHTGAVRCTTFSPDGSRVITGSDDRSAKVWDAANGEELFELRGHPEAVWSVAFSPDGQRVVTGIAGANANVTVWNAAPTPTELPQK